MLKSILKAPHYGVFSALFPFCLQATVANCRDFIDSLYRSCAALVSRMGKCNVFYGIDRIRNATYTLRKFSGRGCVVRSNVSDVLIALYQVDLLISLY